MICVIAAKLLLMFASTYIGNTMSVRIDTISKTELKIEDPIVKLITVERLPESDYRVTLNMNYDDFKYAEWYALVQDMKKYLGHKGFDDISAVEKGVFKVTTDSESKAKQFIELLASEDTLGFTLSVREKNKLLDFLDLPNETPKSLLVKLCWSGEVYDVDQILKYNLEGMENAIDKNGHRPIHIAYLTKNKYLAETLLNHHPRSIDQKNDEGDTILSKAVSDGDQNWYKFICNKDANLNIRYEGKTLLDICVKAFKQVDELYHHAHSLDFSLYTKKQDYVNIAKDLVHKHPEWIARSSENVDSPLYVAKSAHDQSLYNTFLVELHQSSDTTYGKSIFDVLSDVFGL